MKTGDLLLPVRTTVGINKHPIGIRLYNNPQLNSWDHPLEGVMIFLETHEHPLKVHTSADHPIVDLYYKVLHSIKGIGWVYSDDVVEA